MVVCSFLLQSFLELRSYGNRLVCLPWSWCPFHPASGEIIYTHILQRGIHNKEKLGEFLSHFISFAYIFLYSFTGRFNAPIRFPCSLDTSIEFHCTESGTWKDMHEMASVSSFSCVQWKGSLQGMFVIELHSHHHNSCIYKKKDIGLFVWKLWTNIADANSNSFPLLLEAV